MNIKCCLFLIHPVVYFKQIINSAAEIYHKICIHDYVAKYKGRMTYASEILSTIAYNFYHNERPLESLLGKLDWKLKSVVKFLTLMQDSSPHCSLPNSACRQFSKQLFVLNSDRKAADIFQLKIATNKTPNWNPTQTLQYFTMIRFSLNTPWNLAG